MRSKILVTGVGGRSVGAGVIHALMRADAGVRGRWEIVATDVDPFAWGLYVADHRALVPRADSPAYIDRIRDLIEAQGIAAVIPGTELEASLLAAHRNDLPVPVISNDSRLMGLMMDKSLATAKLQALGLASIPSYPWEQRERAVSEFGFPLLVKPTVGTGGSRGAHLIVNRGELEGLVPFVGPDSMPIVQPYLGDSEHEYTVGVISDKSGRIVDSIAIRRKLIGLSLLDSKNYGDKVGCVSTGITQGFIVKNSEIQEFCEDLALKLDSRGPLNLQLRVHEGRFYVFDIHPRFSGTTPIRASVGFNEPDLLLRNHLFDECFGRVAYIHNVAAIRAFEHVLVPISEMLQSG